MTTAHLRAARPRALRRAGALAAAVVAADQLTKHTIATGIAEGQSKKFLPGIQFVHVRNKGVAFGFFSGGGTLVLVFTLVALAILLAFFLARPGRQGLWVATGLLVGGALGNLVDRLTQSQVIDFIKLPLWPAFNVADMAITFGVLALLWVLEGARSSDGREPSK